MFLIVRWKKLRELRAIKIHTLKDKGPSDIDYTVVRENSGDVYAGGGGIMMKAVAINNPTIASVGIIEALLPHMFKPPPEKEVLVSNRAHDISIFFISLESRGVL